MIQLDPVPVPVTLRLSAAERSILPVTASLSAVAPLSSIDQDELAPSVTPPPTCNVPTLAPGAMIPLFVRVPLTVPVPPSVAPAAMVTAPVPVAEPVVLLASSFPAPIVVAPVYVLAALKVNVPAPFLVRPASPLLLLSTPCISAESPPVPAVTVIVLASV